MRIAILAAAAVMAVAASAQAPVEYKIYSDVQYYLNDDNGFGKNYAVAEATVEWPVRLGDYDLTGLQRALVVYDSIPLTGEAMLELLMLNDEDKEMPYDPMGPDCSYVGRPVTLDVLKKYKDSFEAMCNPKKQYDVVLDWFDPEAGVVQMSIDAYHDARNGLAAGCHIYTYYLIYDLKNNREVTLADLFVDKDAVSKLEDMVNAYVAYERENTENCYNTDRIELTDNWTIDRGNALNFFYGKYEIACGAMGTVTIPVYVWQEDFYKLKLSPLGEQLLMDTDQRVSRALQ